MILFGGKYLTWHSRTAQESSVPIALCLNNESVSPDILNALDISRVDTVVLRDVWVAGAVILELDAQLSFGLIGDRCDFGNDLCVDHRSAALAEFGVHDQTFIP